MGKKLSPLSYTADLVHRQDPDRFYTVLLAPPDKREALFALYAFNVEIAQVRHRVTEPLLGHIRFQWWRDHVKEICTGTLIPQHPILTPLAETVRQYHLPFEDFEKLLSGREKDLEDKKPESVEDIIAYVDLTSTPLVSLAVRILSPDMSVPVEAIHHAGLAWGLISWLQTESTSNIEEIAALVEKHIAKARTFRKQIPRAAIPAFLPVRLASLYLKDLRKKNFHTQHSHPWRSLGLIWAAMTGRF